MDGLWHVSFLLVILLNVLTCSASSVSTASDGFRGNESFCVSTYNKLVVAFKENDPVSGSTQEIIQKFNRTNKKPSHLVWVHYCFALPCNSSDTNFTYLWGDSSIFLLIDYDDFIHLTFGLAGINEPKKAFLTIPFFCDEVENETINDFLLTLTTQLTTSSIIGENDWSANEQYYAIRYTNNEFNEDPTNAHYHWLKIMINVWLLITYIMAIIGIHIVICIPKFRQIIGKFFHICDKRMNILLRNDNNFITEPDEEKMYDSYFFSFLQRMVFPIMSATFICILVHDCSNRHAWFHHILPIYSLCVSLFVTLVSAAISTIYLLTQSMPNNFNIIIIILSLGLVFDVCLVIPHGFWLFIALLAYPGQILISCVYIIPPLVIISVVWNIILEIIHSIKSCIGVLCCTKRSKKDEKCNCTSLKADFCFNEKCENKPTYFCLLCCDFCILLVLLLFMITFWGLLIYIVYALIQFINLHVELNLGIFGPLIANTVVVVVTSVLFFVNFFTIELVRRKSYTKPYITLFIINKLKHCENPCSKDNREISYTNCINNLKIVFCCNYKQKSTQLMLQRAVELEFKEIIGCEERDLTQSNEQIHKESNEQIHKESNEQIHKESNEQIHKESNEQIHKESNEQIHKESNEQIRKKSNEQILKNIQEKLVKKIEEIVGAGSETLPFGMIIVAVHNGIQQAIEEEIRGISLLTPVFSQDNQNALQEAVKHDIMGEQDNEDDISVNVIKITDILRESANRESGSTSSPDTVITQST